jgi:vitamin B12 transporter
MKAGFLVNVRTLSASFVAASLILATPANTAAVLAATRSPETSPQAQAHAANTDKFPTAAMTAPQATTTTAAQSTGVQTSVQPVAQSALEEIALDPAELDTTPPPAKARQETAEQKPLSAPGQHAKPLVLQSTKIGLPAKQSGVSSTIITRQDIQQMHADTLLDVLTQSPGVDVVRNGGLGGTSSVFMRGMNSEHTLILVDGIRLNDPMSPGRSFNYLDQVSPDAVEQVEVLRGPQGPLFGSDAMGGVINIITRSGEGPLKLYAQLEGGSYGSLQENASASGSMLGNKLRYFFHANRQDVANMSASSARYGDHERDGYHNTSLMGKLQFQPTDNYSLQLFNTYTRALVDLDNYGGPGGDDPNYYTDNRIWLTGLTSNLKLFDNRFEQITKLSWTNQKRSNVNDTDWDHPFDMERSRYQSNLMALDVINNFYLHPSNTLTLGFNLQKEMGDTRYYSDSQYGVYKSVFDDRSITDFAFYAQDHINIKERLFTTLSARRDQYDRFGGYTSYHADTVFPIRKTGTTFKSSFGTSFKAPTLYQMFSQYGDPNLKPETMLGWDAGVEQALFGNRVQVGVTCFQNQVKNLIQFPVDRYENVAKARMQGLEFYATTQPFKNLRIRSSYTYTDTKDLIGGDPLLRRPRNKMVFNINYQPFTKLNMNLNIAHMGQRDDLYYDNSTFSSRNVKLESFTRVDLAMSYDLTRHINVFARLANLLDSPYELVKGYSVPRFSAYGGLRMSL